MNYESGEELLIDAKIALDSLEAMVEFLKHHQNGKACAFAMQASFAMNKVKMGILAELAKENAKDMKDITLPDLDPHST